MNTEFWLHLWQQGKTGFHRTTPMPLLMKHWPTLALPPGTRVLVPLCGKTPDMIWLRAQGCAVLGVELSPLAIRQFFDEQELACETQHHQGGTRYVADGIEIIQGDVFDLDDATLARCQAVYDRAAIVALPAPLRERYAREIYGRLPAACKGLMLTLEYPQSDMDGPPFSIIPSVVHTLLDDAWDVQELEQRDILASEPDFARRGLTSFHTRAYRLERRA